MMMVYLGVRPCIYALGGYLLTFWGRVQFVSVRGSVCLFPLEGETVKVLQPDNLVSALVGGFDFVQHMQLNDDVIS